MGVTPGAYGASGMDYQQGLRAQSMPLQAMGGGGLGGLGGLGDLKGPLSQMAMQMVMKQLNPPQHPAPPPMAAAPIFSGYRQSPSLMQLYPGLGRG
jgi:hypothetical protein